MSDDDDEKAPVAQHRLGCVKNSTMPSTAAFMFSPSSHLSSLMAKGFSPSPAAHSALSLGQCFGPPTIAMDGHVMERNQGGGGDSEACRNKDEEQESKSGSDNNFDGGTGSGEEQDGSCRPRKKRYHRHTPHQIQEMEMFFKECPHPDDKQRKELSRELGLEPLQVKFWFQNKRTQMKTQHERMENSQLKAENEKLMAENMRYKEALAHATCPTCGGPAALGELSYDEHQLRVENARLREEIDRLSSIAAKCVGKPLNSLPSMPMSRSGLDLGMGFSDVYGVGCNRENSVNTRTLALSYGPTESEKPMVIELAVEAMEELMRLAQMTDPIWTSTSLADETTLQVLNEEEYKISFSSGVGPKPPNFKSEGSKESAVVMISAMSLVEMLLDVNQWTSMFPDIISRGVTVDVLSMGVAGSYNGALQVMYAEFQVPTPLVATRESYFARYCKQHSEGVWAVVDVSLDHIRGNLAPPTMRCRRRPSGLVVQQMPNCYTKVTWVEHVEADERGVHQMYTNVVNSGMAFGAKRWVASLYRQCERLASVMATNIPSSEVAVIPNQEGRKGMLKLAERMVISFCGGVSQSTAHTWITLSGGGAENVRVMTRKSVDDPGRPPGIVLNAATSFWMPLSPSSLFLFLKDHSNRSQWDILSNGAVVQEVAHIANGHDPSNYVSLLRVNSVNPNQSNMLILQESCRDACASYVIYAPVDVPAMNSVLNGSDPDYTALLPSGFAILSDGHGSSLLTVAFQILVNPEPNAKLSLGSVATVNSLISCTIDRIKAALSPPQPSQSQ